MKKKLKLCEIKNFLSCLICSILSSCSFFLFSFFSAKCAFFSFREIAIFSCLWLKIIIISENVYFYFLRWFLVEMSAYKQPTHWIFWTVSFTIPKIASKTWLTFWNTLYKILLAINHEDHDRQWHKEHL